MTLSERPAPARSLDPPELRRFLIASRPLLDASEAAGRLLPELVEGLADIGCLDLMRPRTYGGQDMEYRRVMELVVEAARHSGSLGWCLSIFSFHNMVVRRLPARVVEELFSTPRSLIASALFPLGRAEACDGGYRLTGQWRYTSGIHVADWVMLRAIVEGEGKPYEAGFYAPARLFDVVDDWQVAGMRASGSNSIAARGIQLDRRFKVEAVALEDHRGAELRVPLSYRLPNQMVISLGTLAPAIGMLDAMAAQLPRPAAPGLPLDQFTAFQSQLETVARVGIVVNAFWKEVDNALEALQRPGFLDIERQYECKLRCAIMMRSAAELAGEVFRAAGTKAIFQGHPMSRMLADMQVLSTHFLCRTEPVSAHLAMLARRPG